MFLEAVFRKRNGISFVLFLLTTSQILYSNLDHIEKQKRLLLHFLSTYTHYYNKINCNGEFFIFIFVLWTWGKWVQKNFLLVQLLGPQHFEHLKLLTLKPYIELPSISHSLTAKPVFNISSKCLFKAQFYYYFSIATCFFLRVTYFSTYKPHKGKFSKLSLFCLLFISSLFYNTILGK